MKVSFAKMCATGNDFIVIDNRDGAADPLNADGIRNICTRRLSVGADGLILIEDDCTCEFSMKYYNSDGHEASMCGNGARCAALFAYLIGAAREEMVFRSGAGCHSASLESVVGERSNVSLSMPDPSDIQPEGVLQVGEEELAYGFVNTGVPHVVLRVDDLDSIDVPGAGRRIRDHETFRGGGTNVDFIEVQGAGIVRARTYERGVEDETLSCGTGAVASAVMASIWFDMKGPIRVGTASGEDLQVSFERIEGLFRHVMLRGEALVVYWGSMAVW